MKKVNFWLVLLGILCLMATTSCAEVSRVYRNEELNLAFSVPDEWVYDDSGEVELFRLAANGDKNDALLEFVVEDVYSSMASQGYTRSDLNMSLMKENDAINKIASALGVSANSVHLITLGEYEYYEYYAEGKQYYYNLDDGYEYSFMYSGKNSYVLEVENVIKTVVHYADDIPNPAQKVDLIENKADYSDSWMYNDNQYHCTFVVPNEWVAWDEDDKSELNEKTFYLANSGEKNNCWFMYASYDFCKTTSPSEGDTSEIRKTMNNAIFTPYYFEVMGNQPDDIDVVDIGEYKYYKYKMAGYYNYCHAENGYMYEFTYDGNEEYIDEVEEVIKTVQYNW